MFADAGDDILQFAALGHVIEHVIDGDQRNERPVRQYRRPLEAAQVIAAIEHAGGKPDGFLRGRLFQPQQQRMQLVGIERAPAA